MPVAKLKKGSVYRLNPTEANEAWLQSARLIKQGRMDEVLEMDKEPLFLEPFDENDVRELEETREAIKQRLRDRARAVVGEVKEFLRKEREKTDVL